MKYIILVPDGMSGTPLDELNGRTCMEAADIRNMDLLARKGIVGTACNVPKGMIPASDVANLSILGYDPSKYYCGRGPLEAANLGVRLNETDVAFRFNMTTVSQGKMADYSAGHITTDECKILIRSISEKFGSDRFKFYPGCSYRNLMVMSCGSKEEAEAMADLTCHPPHDILDKPFAKYYPASEELVKIMEGSQELLHNNDVNKVRIDLGQNPANMIWFWGQGKSPVMPKFKDAFGITGAIISAVDLIKGIGRVVDMDVIDVPGATGYYDTNYEGKAEAALKALEEKDLVFLHVEAPDEASHNGDILAKINAIENFDNKVVATIINELTGKCDFRVLLTPDHPTPVNLRTHTSDPVPFALAGTGIDADEVTVYTERSAQAGSMLLEKGHELLKFMVEK